MHLLALLRFIPGVSRLLGTLVGWLTRRKWGNFLMMYLALGIGRWIEKIVTFAGVMLVVHNFAAPALMPMISGPLLGLPDEWQQFMALTRIDEAISIIISAVVVRASASVTLQRNPNSPAWHRNA